MIKVYSNCCKSEVKKYYEISYCNECLLITKRKYKLKYINFSVLFLFLIIPETTKYKKEFKIYPLKQVEIVQNEFLLNDSFILDLLIKKKVIAPTIALAQSKLETGNYTSNLCKNNKNLFGIRYVKQKQALGEKNGFAYYETYFDCIEDYVRINNWYCEQLISKKYAEGQNYISNIKKMKYGR